jgi:DNA repair exonuclease SbcCD ATPase subunit
MQTRIDTLKNKIELLGQKLNQAEGQYSLLKTQYEQHQAQVKILEIKKELTSKAIELLSVVQGITREKIKNEFETLVTYILKFVTEKDYQFVIEFEKRGNLQELDFRVKTPDNIESLDMLDTCGGGILDLVSFALRIVLMQTAMPKIEGFVLLDESFKHLSTEYRERIPLLLEELSKKLKRQFIVISHETELIESNFNKIEVK